MGQDAWAVTQNMAFYHSYWLLHARRGGRFSRGHVSSLHEKIVIKLVCFFQAFFMEPCHNRNMALLDFGGLPAFNLWRGTKSARPGRK